MRAFIAEGIRADTRLSAARKFQLSGYPDEKSHTLHSEKERATIVTKCYASTCEYVV